MTLTTPAAVMETRHSSLGMCGACSKMILRDVPRAFLMQTLVGMLWARTGPPMGLRTGPAFEKASGVVETYNKNVQQWQHKSDTWFVTTTARLNDVAKSLSLRR